MVQEDIEILINFPLSYLKVCGRDPHMSWRVSLFSALLFTISFVSFYAGIIANFFYLEGNLFYFVVNCEGFSVLFQLYAKIVVSIFLKNNFIELVAIARGWKFEECPSSVKTDIEFIINTTKYIQKFYGRSMLAGTALVMVFAIFTKQLPTGIWNIPDQEIIYYILLIMQELTAPLYIIFAIGLDCLFLAFCILLIIQFKILSVRIKELKVPSNSNEIDSRRFFINLGKCIEQHSFLLQYGKLLRDTYSPILLLEFITICMTAFAELYLVFQSDNIVHFMRGVFLFFNFMLELAFYCIAATITTTEVSKVANAIYESDWNSNYVPQLGSTVVTIIGRAQRDLTFTAGGLTDINLKTLITVVQFAWSVCTVMTGLHKK